MDEVEKWGCAGVISSYMRWSTTEPQLWSDLQALTVLFLHSSLKKSFSLASILAFASHSTLIKSGSSFNE